MMMSYKVLALALLSYSTQTVLADTPSATLYTKEPCQGETLDIKADGKYVVLPDGFQKNVNGVEIPEGVVCNFYGDEKHDDPLLIGLEDPGECSFSGWDIANKTVTVQCYESDSIYDQ